MAAAPLAGVSGAELCAMPEPELFRRVADPAQARQLHRSIAKAAVVLDDERGDAAIRVVACLSSCCSSQSALSYGRSGSQSLFGQSPHHCQVDVSGRRDMRGLQR